MPDLSANTTKQEVTCLPGQRCAIYIRVSTAEQAMHGKSLNAQTEYLTQYAHRHNMEIIGIFSDEGKTARKNFKDRKAIKKLLEHVRLGEVDIILFWKMDRWFRNVSDFYKVQDILDAHKVTWIAAAEPNMNMDTREGRLNLNIMLSINQNETDTTSERIRFVNEASVTQGKVITGAQPLGYQISTGENGIKRIEKDPEKEWLVNEFFHYYLLHQSKRGAVFYLTEKYGPVITMRQVLSLCSNPMYCGSYRGNPAYCPPYITPEQFKLLQEINQQNIKMYSSHHATGEVYLFTGLIRCPVCSRMLSSCRITTNSHTGKPLANTLRYYRCQNWSSKKTCSYSKTVNEASLENSLLSYIKKAEEGRQPTMVLVRSVSKAGQPVKILPDQQTLKKELERLNYIYQKGRISEQKYNTEYERLSLEINVQAQTKEEIKQTGYTDQELESILCTGWLEIYKRLTRENKRAFWRSVLKEIQVNSNEGTAKDFLFS